MNVLLTGGGTGGHVYPALAIAEALRARPEAQPLSLLYVGTRDRLEARIVPKAGIPLAFVAAAPLQRKLSFSLLRTLALNAVGILQALVILHRFRPDCIVATGGYVTFPIVAAMRLVRALGLSRGKIALLEPNARPGLTNRLLEPLVDEIWVSYGEKHGLAGKAVMTGTPVRAMFAELPSAREARLQLGLDPEKTTIVAMGGSQGARSLNAAFASLPLPDTWQVLVLTGGRDDDLAARPGLIVRAYLDDPRAAYAAADVVVARAGASTLAELAATRTPAVLVPYPYATDGHQMHNAARYASTGAARVLLDRELDAASLSTTLREMLQEETLVGMRRAASFLAPRDASERTARRVVDLLREKGPQP
jgi:UDP-N-acetylglucosamine--N-acetylmuramyl-(pentapeptide) pyrophosphoryl-undecaprenol N-acetylglucosamine transferase